MATWKRILTTDDAVTNTNLGNTDLTSADAARVFKLASGTAVLGFQDNSGNNILSLATQSGGTHDIRLYGGVSIYSDAASNQGSLKLFEGAPGSEYVELKANTSATANYTLTLPAADGTSGQVLQTNGSGTLSFVTPSSGVTASGTPSNNQLAVWTTASEIEGDSNLTWTGTQFNIAGGAILSADLIKMNGRAPTSPAAGEVGVGGNVITQFHSSGSVTAGGVYVAGSSAWVQADADAGSTATGLLAVATDAASAAEMLIEGSVKLASNTGFSTASKGDVLYLSLTAGQLTNDISGHTTGDYVRVCGYVIDASKNYVYFSPSKDWIEL